MILYMAQGLGRLWQQEQGSTAEQDKKDLDLGLEPWF